MRLGTENLYIDESGSGAIYEPPPKNYQFFNMAGVVIDDANEKLLSSEIRKWKDQYLQTKGLTFHTVDFFEDFKETSVTSYKYKKQSLTNIKKFYHATLDLLAVFNSVKFNARVYYIDLNYLRVKLNFNKYITGKQNILKDVINKEYKGSYLQPISTILQNFFVFHEGLILAGKKPGYICFESQREFDELTARTFHQTLHHHNQAKQAYLYGKNILGLHFNTKAALCASLELADFIAYCSTQYLRKEVNSKELKISTERLAILLQAYKSFKQKQKIILRNVTDDCIQEFKAIHTPQKKARL